MRFPWSKPKNQVVMRLEGHFAPGEVTIPAMSSGVMNIRMVPSPDNPDVWIPDKEHSGFEPATPPQGDEEHSRGEWHLDKLPSPQSVGSLSFTYALWAGDEGIGVFWDGRQAEANVRRVVAMAKVCAAYSTQQLEQMAPLPEPGGAAEQG